MLIDIYKLVPFLWRRSSALAANQTGNGPMTSPMDGGAGTVLAAAAAVAPASAAVRMAATHFVPTQHFIPPQVRLPASTDRGGGGRCTAVSL